MSAPAEASSSSSGALAGRVAPVTAAGRGIGRATAKLLAVAGALVVVTDIDPAPTAQVVSDIEAAGGRAESGILDVADEAAVVATIAEIASRHGTIDVLVSNAGIGNRTASESNVASVMGLTGASLYPNPAYHASKAALINWTRALAVEWAGRGVRVNAVAPGYVATAYTRKVFATPEYRARILARQVLGRLVEPEEVAAAIVFLASDAASGITGVTLPVDGGWSAG